MSQANAELVLDAACTLAEGPVWWDSALWFVDIEGRELHRFEERTGDHQTFPTPGRIGCAIPSVRGDWVIAQDAAIARFRPTSGELSLISHVEPADQGTRLNDGKCDPTGRLYAGTMHLDASPGAGALYRFGSETSAERIVGSVTISNGLAWDEARGTMYYIDTPTGRIDGFEWCAETGAISHRRPVAVLDDGSPDGMCIDREGMLWVAMWGGSRVARVDPGAGREVASVRLPCAHVTSCCFGGDSLDRLWITTARAGLSEAELQLQPAAGGVFAADVGAAGLPTTPLRW